MGWNFLPQLIARGVDAATFGASDRFAQWATGSTNEQLAQMRAARAADTGAVGDVVEGGATLLPFAKAGQLMAVGRRALAGGSAVTSARGAALLGIEAPAAIPGAVARIAANPVRNAVLGLGLAGLANAGRNAQAAGPAATAAVPGVGAVSPQLAMNREATRPYTAEEVAAARTAMASATAPAEVTPFQRTIEAFGRNSGGMSLNELSALAGAENNARPNVPRATARPPTARDLAGQAALQSLSQVWQQQQEAIASSNQTAEAKAAALDVAHERLQRRLIALAGANPANVSTAEMLDQ